AEPLFPVLSIIDPELMVTLPRDLTIYQGLDALFHASECLITNRGENLLVDAYANESIASVVHYLPQVVEDPNNLEARTRVSYAANICSGYTQSLIGTTSHHIIAQTIGGMFPNVPHGAALVMIAEEYYRKISTLAMPELNRLAAYFGIESSDGLGWSLGLGKFFEKLGVRHLPMSAYGIAREDLPQIADYTVNRTGISDVDNYTLTVEDVLEILEKSYC
ncbi:MAG: iron-containing alcohol dehydrogenase, partial [Ellagibacter isourolithinifaciens]